MLPVAKCTAAIGEGRVLMDTARAAMMTSLWRHTPARDIYERKVTYTK